MQSQTGLRVNGNNTHNETTTNANAIGGRSSSQGKETTDSSLASPPVVLCRAAFALPSPLRSLQVCTAVKSCGFWFFTSELLPVDKRRTQVPSHPHPSAQHAAGGGYGTAHSSAMHAALDLTSSLAVDDMDWRAAGGASKARVLAAEMTLVAFQVSFSRSKYPELFTPLDPIRSPQPLRNRRQMSGNTSSSLPSAQSKGQQRQPFSNVASPHDSSDANDDGRQYGFFQQCDGDDDDDDDDDDEEDDEDDVGGGNPSGNHSPPNTISSHEDAASAGSSPSSYQQQALLSPVKGKVSYVLSLAPAAELGSNCISLDEADGRGWVIEQQLDGRIEEVELIVHLDMRPIERAIYECILPVVALASKTSGNRGVEVEPSEQQIAAAMAPSNVPETRLIAPESLLGLLGTLPSIAELTAKLSVEGVSVYLVNDFYRQPATVARTLCHSVTISASILPCLRMQPENAYGIEGGELLFASQQALNQPDHDQGLGRSQDQKHSSASLQSVRSTSNSSSHDNIATSPLLRIVQSLNLPSAAVNAVMQPPAAIMSMSRAASPSFLEVSVILYTPRIHPLIFFCN